jgi:hypothetical protein
MRTETNQREPKRTVESGDEMLYMPSSETNGVVEMAYKLIGTGPQFPRPYEQSASTAAEALNLQEAIKNLCGEATIFDANGRKICVEELWRAKDNEQAQEPLASAISS